MRILKCKDVRPKFIKNPPSAALTLRIEGVEIDLVIEQVSGIISIEIKSAQTYTKDFSRNLKKFMSYSHVSEAIVVHDGAQRFKGSDGIELMNWVDFLTN